MRVALFFSVPRMRSMVPHHGLRKLMGVEMLMNHTEGTTEGKLWIRRREGTRDAVLKGINRMRMAMACKSGKWRDGRNRR